jgi:hypothetical protein
MRKYYTLLFIGFICTVPIFAQNAETPMLEASLSEVSSVDAIVKTLYQVISGPAKQRRNWNKFRSLFRPEARLNSVGKSPDGKSKLTTMTQEDYIRNVGPIFDEKGFFEQEIGRSLEKFGNMVHVFSAYETRYAIDGKVEGRGINSIQLVQKDGRFWILNIMWNPETLDNPIPEKYLKK